MKKITCGQLNIEDVNKKVNLYGWIKKTRKMGEILFGDIEDRYGVTQFVISRSNPNFNTISSLSRGSVIQLEGIVIERKSKNKNIPTGDIELEVQNAFLINKSQTLPMIIEDKTDALEDVRMTYRYLDLRRRNIKETFIKRHNVIKNIRNFFDNRDFIHLETPILSKPTPEGAKDFLVEYSSLPGKFFALPQSPQIYKQLSMIAGFEKYYQIARCFRNEDLRSDRQLEFTQLDLEMSFVNEEDIMKTVESLLKDIMKKSEGVNIETPFERISYKEAMNSYGSDKPDTRYGLKLFDITNYIKNSGFEYLTNHPFTKAIFVPENLSRKQTDKLNLISKNFQGVSYTFAKGEWNPNLSLSGPASKKIEKELEVIFNDKELKSGTIIIVSGEWEKCVSALGAIREECGNILNLKDSRKFNFLWVVDWPLFEFSEEEGRYVAMHHPFTMPDPSSVADFHIDQKNAGSRAYDIVLNGYEIGGGSIRIHTPEMQRRMFEALGMTKDEYENKFSFLLQALSYGAPTHGGVALGIDRLIMLLEGKETLKDVIAFPVNSSGVDMMMNSPSVIK